MQAEVETPTLGAENTKTLGATFVNAKLASGADVFTGVEYDNKGNAYETIQCTHTSEAQVLHAEEVKAELEGCADPAGVFLLVSNRPWKDTPENVKRLEEACRQYAAVGLVHEGNFRDYFLPTFASMWQRRIPQQSSPTGMLGRAKMSTRIATHTDTDSSPSISVLRSWAPPRWDTTRAPAGRQSWLPPKLPLAAPRSAVNLLLLRRAAKVFS